MKKPILAALIAILFGSCSKPAEKSLSYTVIENKVYSIPAKSQVSYRVYLNEKTYTDSQLTALTDSLFWDAKYTKTEYHNQATHVYVYVYAKQGDFELNGGDWIAMRSKENNQETETKLKAAQ